MRNHFEAIIEKGCILRKKSSNLFITIVKLEGPFDNNRFKITQQYSKKKLTSEGLGGLVDWELMERLEY